MTVAEQHSSKSVLHSNSILISLAIAKLKTIKQLILKYFKACPNTNTF